MTRERIHATPKWRNEGARYDCAFVSTNPLQEGMRGMDIVRIYLFFSFKAENTIYPCALVQWYSRVGDHPDPDTGMWKVRPDINSDGSPTLAVIHLDTIVRAALLIGVYGSTFIPDEIQPTNSLDIFQCYYVNKYADHHSYEIAF